jgi:uncharacterized membrane protein
LKVVDIAQHEPVRETAILQGTVLEATAEWNQKSLSRILSRRSKNESLLNSDIIGSPRLMAGLLLSTVLNCALITLSSAAINVSTRWRFASLAVINTPIELDGNQPRRCSMLLIARYQVLLVWVMDALSRALAGSVGLVSH